MISFETPNALPNWFSEDEVRGINSMVRVSSSRTLGLTVMNKVLSQCDLSVINNFGIPWLIVTAETVTMAYENDSVRFLAAKNFGQILKICCQIPDLARTISLNHINVIFRQLLDYNSSSVLPSLKCIKSILKYFPGPCGEFKGKLVKYLAPLMQSISTHVKNKSIKCWCYIPIIGGGGKDKKEHAKQYERQFQEALDSLIYVTNRIFNNSSLSQENSDIDPSVNSLSLLFPEIPKPELQKFYSLFSRYEILCKCLSGMLQSQNFSAVVMLPFNKLISCILLSCSTSLQTFGYTSEMRLRSRYLSHFHQCSLNMLKVLMQNFSHEVCQFSKAINHMFINILSVWRHPTNKDEFVGDCSSIRASFYEVAILWVQCCGWKSKFLCEENLGQIMLSNIVNDITFQTHLNDVKWDVEQTKKNGKRKTEPVQGQNLNICYRSYSLLRVNALKVVRLSLYSHGSQMPIIIHKDLQETAIKLLLQMKYLTDHAYNNCEASRSELYHLLLALCIAPHHKWPAPIHFAINLLKQASSIEKSLTVRTVINEALLSLSHIIRPQAPALHLPSSNFVEECIKKHSQSKPTEQQNILLDSQNLDMQRVVCIDAQTSTDDLISFDRNSLTEFYSKNDTESLAKTLTENDNDNFVEEDETMSVKPAIEPTSEALDKERNEDFNSVKRKSPSDENLVDYDSKKQKIEDSVSICNNDDAKLDQSPDENFTEEDLSDKDIVIKAEQAVGESLSFESVVASPKNKTDNQTSVFDMIADFVDAEPDNKPISDSNSL